MEENPSYFNRVCVKEGIQRLVLAENDVRQKKHAIYDKSWYEK